MAFSSTYKETIPISGSALNAEEIRTNFSEGPNHIKHDLAVSGSVWVGADGATYPSLYFYKSDDPMGGYLRYNTTQPWFEFSKTLIVSGDLWTNLHILSNKNIYINYDYTGGDEDAYLYFNYNNQALLWDQSYQEFRFYGKSNLVNFNLRGDQILIGDRTTAPSSGYKYLLFAPNSDAGIGGASPGIRYDYTNSTLQFSNDGITYLDFPYGGLTGSIDGILGLGWTAYSKSMAVGHIYATGEGNANTPVEGQSYIGLDAKLDTGDPTIEFACGGENPITGSIRLDYSESEFVVSEDLRLHDAANNVNRNLYIKDLTLSSTDNVNHINLDNNSFIESTINHFHIEAPAVLISSDVETSGSLQAQQDIYVNSDYLSGSGVANLYFNGTERRITHLTDEDTFQLTAERLQIGYGAGSGSGINPTIEVNIDASEHPALGGIDPYLRYNKTSGVWEMYDVSGSRLVGGDISGSVGTLQAVTDNGSYTTHNIQLANLYADGNLYANYSGGDGDSYLYFYEGSATGKYLKWDDGDNRFEFNSNVYTSGKFIAASSGSSFPSLNIGGNLNVGGEITGTVNFTNANVSGVINVATSGSWFKDTAINGDFFVYNGDVTADQLYSRGDLYVNSEGPDGDSYLYFYDGDAPAGSLSKMG